MMTPIWTAFAIVALAWFVVALGTSIATITEPEGHPMTKWLKTKELTDSEVFAVKLASCAFWPIALASVVAYGTMTLWHTLRK